MNLMTLKKFIALESILLFAQYWLGMMLNLFIELPQENSFDFFSYAGGAEVLAHMANGILILLVALIITACILEQCSSLLSILFLIAIASVGVAIAVGFMFILEDQSDFLSMVMAMSFVFVYTIYFYGLYVIGRAEISKYNKS
jgi:hypothetical protein